MGRKKITSDEILIFFCISSLFPCHVIFFSYLCSRDMNGSNPYSAPCNLFLNIKKRDVYNYR